MTFNDFTLTDEETAKGTAYASSRSLVEALHRPPAVGVRQPRRPLLLLSLVLLPVLAAFVAILGALRVAVRRGAAPALCLDRTYSISLHADDLNY